MVVVAVTVFLGAFLLFLVQPLVGRIVVPWFGGGAPVWTASLIFFQTALLAGYAYAAFIVRHLTPRAQAAVHMVLIAASLASLPLAPDPSWKPTDGAMPAPRILALLASSVGPTYVLLASGGPLLQAWLARRGTVPWRLFALSNFASLAALLAYPFLIEPWLGLTAQRLVWSMAYAAYAVLILRLAWQAWHIEREGATRAPVGSEAAVTPSAARLNWPAADTEGRPALWIALAAVPSALLIAVTEYLTRDVAPMPLLWIPPLVLYLATFVIWFDGKLPYFRPLWLALAALAIIGMVMAMKTPSLVYELLPSALILGGGMFVVTLFCHGELASLRPAPSRLGGYYLSIAAGGALGGAVVGLLFPAVLSNTYDLEIVLGAAGALVVLRGFALSRVAFRAAAGVLGLAAVVFAGWAGWSRYESARHTVSVSRNFYGTLRISEHNHGTPNHYRDLAHGSILHGFQFLDPEKRHQAVGYYSRTSGVGRAIGALPQQRPHRVGVVGLGTGALAAHNRAGDTYRFYDIDPGVVDVARLYFTYVDQAPGQVDIVIGDARLSLEREPPQRYDVLAVDAFSGDAIPLHLLTLEAIDVYLKHLAPDGVLAVHTSNRFLNLPPVLERAARARGLAIAMTRDLDERGDTRSDWVLMARDAARLSAPSIKEITQALKARPDWRPWTDDHVDLLRALW